MHQKLLLLVLRIFLTIKNKFSWYLKLVMRFYCFSINYYFKKVILPVHIILPWKIIVT